MVNAVLDRIARSQRAERPGETRTARRGAAGGEPSA